MSKSLIQPKNDKAQKCPGGFQKIEVLYVPKVAFETEVDFA